MKMRVIALSLLFLLAASATAVATERKPPWLADEVVVAATNIGLSEEQMEPFRQIVFTFLDSYGEEVRRLIRRNDPDLQTHIDRKRRSLARKMDRDMAGLLSEAQMPAYEIYRRALLDELEAI